MNGQTNKIQWQRVKYQYLATGVVNLATIGFGVFEGWNSPATLLLMDGTKTPLPTGALNIDEASWVASLQCIGSLFENFLFGYVMNNFGRRLPLILIAFPLIISWLLTWFAQNLYYLYAARLIGGFFSGGGGYIIAPLFIAEISDDQIRGFLTTTHIFTENIGMLMGYIIGAFFPYPAMPIFGIAVAALSAISIYLLPETPLFLVKQQKILEAEKSIRFYQNISKSEDDRKILDVEIDRLKGIINDIHSESSDNSFDWSELKTAVARKALLIGIVVVALSQFSGVVAMLNYTAKIFQEAGSSLEPNHSTIVVGAVQIIGNFIATNLVDRAGRKLLLATSAIGMALGLAVLGVYMMLKSWHIDVATFGWIPLASFSFVVFVSQLGVLSLPFIILAEIMPEKIKDGCCSFCMSLLWIFSFMTTKYLPMLNDVIGFHSTMFFFAGCCVCGATFLILFQPETKCKSHEEIMKSLE